jgi:hypothetical protein
MSCRTYWTEEREKFKLGVTGSLGDFQKPFARQMVSLIADSLNVDLAVARFHNIRMEMDLALIQRIKSYLDAGILNPGSRNYDAWNAAGHSAIAQTLAELGQQYQRTSRQMTPGLQPPLARPSSSCTHWSSQVCSHCGHNVRRNRAAQNRDRHIRFELPPNSSTSAGNYDSHRFEDLTPSSALIHPPAAVPQYTVQQPRFVSPPQTASYTSPASGWVGPVGQQSVDNCFLE